MKRYFIVVLIALITISLSACNNTSSNKDTSDVINNENDATSIVSNENDASNIIRNENDTYMSVYDMNIVENVPTDHKIYENLDEIFNDSDLVVIVTPTNEYYDNEPTIIYRETPRGPSIEQFYTKRNVDILKIIKGNIEKSNLDIIEQHAYLKETNTLMLEESITPMRMGMKYMLFLKYHKMGDEYNYEIATIGQGRYNIDDKDIDEKNIKSKYFIDTKSEALERFSDAIKSVEQPK